MGSRTAEKPEEPKTSRNGHDVKCMCAHCCVTRSYEEQPSLFPETEADKANYKLQSELHETDVAYYSLGFVFAGGVLVIAASFLIGLGVGCWMAWG